MSYYLSCAFSWLLETDGPEGDRLKSSFATYCSAVINVVFNHYKKSVSNTGKVYVTDVHP